MKKTYWWILNYARPLGPAPIIYEGHPPSQSISLVWIEDEERYLQDPYSEGSPEKFNSEFEALSYLKQCGYPLEEIEIRRIPNLKLIKKDK